MEKPCSENCCKMGFSHSAKYMLEVQLNGNWWHFKCCETKADSMRWKKWMEKDYATVRIVKPNVEVNG